MSARPPIADGLEAAHMQTLTCTQLYTLCLATHQLVLDPRTLGKGAQFEAFTAQGVSQSSEGNLPKIQMQTVAKSEPLNKPGNCLVEILSQFTLPNRSCPPTQLLYGR